MKQCGRVIFQSADGTEWYSHVWDETLELALLSRGACTVRQGGQAYAYQGAPSPPAIASAPVMVTTDPTPALTALKAAVDALPQAADQTAAFAALKIATGTVLTAVLKLPDPTPALAALAKQQVVAGVATSIDVTVPDSSGGTLPVDVGQLIYIPNPKVANPPDPIFTVNGKAVAGTVATNVTA